MARTQRRARMQGGVAVRTKGPAERGVTDFMREVSEYAMLSLAEERRLLGRVQALRAHERVRGELKTELGRQATQNEVAMRLGMAVGALESERTECLQARDELVRGNLRLVVHVASMQYGARSVDSSGVALADLIQEGCVGLVRAAERFDVSKGERFAPYAFRAVWGRCQRANVPVGCIVTMPHRLKAAVRKKKRGYMRRGDCGDGAHGDGSKVAQAEVHLTGGVSLDAPLGRNGGGCMMDVLLSSVGRPEEVVDRRLMRGAVWVACEKRLSARDAAVIKMRFGLGDGRPVLVKEIARRVGVSASRVAQIVWQAVDTLRRSEPGLAEYLHDL